tara:strand:- start:7270 stop:8577 length:1308 start_codon:yes stop_codon:yes gene_type:complete
MRKKAIQILNSKTPKDVFMVKNMKHNKAFKLSKNTSATNLKLMQENFKKYRENWTDQPKKVIEKKINQVNFKKKKIIPLCVDLEVAAVCDLACPHCFRQYISTPDKIMRRELVIKLIDQASELGVPSMKFNWRGEPLLHPQLPEFIAYAKQKGILETIINTNATKLNESYSKKLIESGLDLLIFSFDGGSKKTYEKLRPGRFKENSFETIYKNIIDFCKLRKKLKSFYPRTKIQMVLTKETMDEKESFYKLFEKYVDDISVKQYTERGGQVKNLKYSDEKIQRILQENNLKKNAEILTYNDNEIYASTGRLPCEQPFQRLLITYDGRVSACCYDWGSMHTLGYVDDLAFKIKDKHYKEVIDSSEKKKTGFELMNLKMPACYNTPKEKISTLSDIWYGNELADFRKNHLSNSLENIEICKNCTFKETYKWKKIKIS